MRLWLPPATTATATAALTWQAWTASDFHLVFFAGMVFSTVTIVAGLFFLTPYGKLSETSALGNALAIDLDPRWGWFFMELPATLFFWGTYLQTPHRADPLPMALAALWGLHYLNRGWVFPALIRVAKGKKASFSLTVVVIGWLFTSMHGYLSAKWYGEVGSHLHGESPAWLSNPLFWFGLVAYQASFWTVVHSEHIQRNLRSANPAPNEPQYKIPFGGAFQLVTNPTYFFELSGWLAFMLMTLNPGGLVVFLTSCGNLVPRAFQTHAWYLAKFGDKYPRSRKVLIPFVL